MDSDKVKFECPHLCRFWGGYKLIYRVPYGASDDLQI